MVTNKAKVYRSANKVSIVTSTNESAINLMLEVYKSVLDADNVLYCSAPITSGKRYIEWLEYIKKNFVDIDSADEGDRELHFKEVIEPNRARAQQLIQKLRKETGHVVVDPTAILSIPGWTQHDWRSFWRQVIEKYVTIAFYVDGWQYSNGCAYEFWVAQKKRIPTLDESGSPLSLAVGIDLVEEAIIVMRQRGGSTAFIEEMLEKMKDLSTAPTESVTK